jgi:ferrous iron transport protein A
MTTLDTLNVGQRARIVDVLGDDGISVRLMEMGMTEGEVIELIGFAPLGDPIEFLIRGYRVSLRSGEARRVEVEQLDDEPDESTIA